MNLSLIEKLTVFPLWELVKDCVASRGDTQARFQPTLPEMYHAKLLIVNINWFINYKHKLNVKLHHHNYRPYICLSFTNINETRYIYINLAYTFRLSQSFNYSRIVQIYWSRILADAISTFDSSYHFNISLSLIYVQPTHESHLLVRLNILFNILYVIFST